MLDENMLDLHVLILNEKEIDMIYDDNDRFYSNCRNVFNSNN